MQAKTPTLIPDVITRLNEGVRGMRSKGADSIRLPDNAAKASQPMTTFQRVSLALGAALLFVAAMPILFILVAIIGDITGWYRLENYMNSADH
jgi:hypothetical protein